MTLYILVLLSHLTGTETDVAVNFYPSMASCTQAQADLGRGLCMTRYLPLRVEPFDWSKGKSAIGGGELPYNPPQLVPWQ